MLNEIAEQQLRKAGWYPGRKVDISDQIDFWESLGYQTFDAAVKFMEEYGNTIPFVCQKSMLAEIKLHSPELKAFPLLSSKKIITS